MWPGSLTAAWVEIDVVTGEPPQRWEGDISVDLIAFKLESETTDLIKSGRLWRLVLSFSSTPTYEQVVVNGKVRRYDGASAT